MWRWFGKRESNTPRSNRRPATRRCLFEQLEPRRPLTVFVVDPAGRGGTPNDNNPGTVAQPLATFYRARDLAQPGDTVELRSAVYEMLRPEQAGADINNRWISRSGLPGEPITYANYPGETPVLDFSEQYAWQWDSANGWWTTLLPRSSAVAQYSDVHVYRQEGQLAVAVAGLNDLASPPGTFVSGGQLVYDLSYYDATTQTVYFRPASAAPLASNPQQDLKIVSDSSQFYLCGLQSPLSYVTISGLTFRFGAMFHVGDKPGIAPPDHIEILGNTITDFSDQGLEANLQNSLVQGNFIDRIGGQWSLSNGTYAPTAFSHCFYFSGASTTIANNFFGRSFSGYSVQVYPSSSGLVFNGNVAYGHNGATVLVAGSNMQVAGNVIIAPNAGPAFEMFPNVSGLVFSGNFAQSNQSPVVYSGLAVSPASVQNFQVTGNILDGAWGLDLDANVVLPGSLLAQNKWLNTEKWYIGVAPFGYPPQPQLVAKDYAAYANFAAQYGWEGSSSWSTTSTTYDHAAIEQMLDGPNYLQVPGILRSYAQSLGFQNATSNRRTTRRGALHS